MGTDLSLVAEGNAAKELPTKVCPVCGQVLFADMDTCYGCLHDFRKKPGGLPLGFPPTLFAARTAERLPLGDVANLGGSMQLDEPIGVDDSGEGSAVVPAPSFVGDDGPPVEVVTQVMEPEGDGCCYLRLMTQEVDADVEVGERGLLVGRSASCDVVLHARAVSRRHVLVRATERGLVVADQGATNPARIDDRPLEGEAMLLPGQTLEVCGTRFVVRRRG